MSIDLIDRLERAAMAYERLGKLHRDDEKTRQIRKDTMAELAEARRAVADAIRTARADALREAAEVAGLYGVGKAGVLTADKIQAAILALITEKTDG